MEIKHIERLAILLSILIHLLVIHSFIFTFSPSFVSQKPTFIFLGSLLPKEDLINFSSMEKSSSAKKVISEIDILTQQSHFYVQNEPVIKKPVFATDIRKSPKTFLKSLFNIENHTPQTENLEKILGIEPNVPTYKPLRLDLE